MGIGFQKIIGKGPGGIRSPGEVFPGRTWWNMDSLVEWGQDGQKDCLTQYNVFKIVVSNIPCFTECGHQNNIKISITP